MAFGITANIALSIPYNTFSIYTVILPKYNSRRIRFPGEPISCSKSNSILSKFSLFDVFVKATSKLGLNSFVPVGKLVKVRTHLT